MVIRPIKTGVPPIDAFAALHERPHSFFLESVLTSEGMGRFSYIGFEPAFVFQVCNNAAFITRGNEREQLPGDPLEELQKLLKNHAGEASSKWPFTGGAVGWFSYEFGTRFEKIHRPNGDDLNIPKVELGFYEAILAFDSETEESVVIANPADPERADEVAGQFAKMVLAAIAVQRGKSASDTARPISAPQSNLTRGTYTSAVAKIRDYIAAGDVYQVNLSHRFEAPLELHPFEIYRRLRRHSPAPYASYLNFGEVQIVSCSPERFLSIAGNRAETRPIKGTRPRGRDATEDAALAAELLASEKDRAELLMIVDLERNDLGRICEFGSIAVSEPVRLESHPTVHHLVATVTGRLRPRMTIGECLRATFPGGSITGAPKIRAMQIIDELESGPRHVYTGAIGWIGFNGDCDLNVAIRTITCTGGKAFYHVGSGIVWDSDAAAEYDETLAKGRALWQALCDHPTP